MQEQEKRIRRISLSISKNSDNMQAPLSDIENQVEKALESGVSEEQVKSMVPEMLRNSSTWNYSDGRTPRKDEILVYSIPSDLEDLVVEPE